ncbi:MAG: endonuclease III domain-containing protein [Thermoplasmataceae archaeon]
MNTGEIYANLLNRYGDMKWWPANSTDEVVIGAVLTQNTSWKNVEKALNLLAKNGILSLKGISESGELEIINAIKPSGFFNRKARTLRVLATEILKRYGSIEMMKAASLSEIMNFLNGVSGIGNETRDDILLYALDIPVFIVDSYTKRIMTRVRGSLEFVESSRFVSETIYDLGTDVGKLKNYHAMLVQLGKDYCRSSPLCSGCPLKNMCLYARDHDL